MAKQNMIQREIKRLSLVTKYAKKRQQIRADLKKATSLLEIFALQKTLQRLPLNSLPIRLRNRCWKTGRSRGYYRDFGLSRHVIREMAHECLLPGVIKASW
jgi:small subunit ribosomal protein S14